MCDYQQLHFKNFLKWGCYPPSKQIEFSINNLSYSGSKLWITGFDHWLILIFLDISITSLLTGSF